MTPTSSTVYYKKVRVKHKKTAMNYHDSRNLKAIAKIEKQISRYNLLAKIAAKLGCVKCAAKWALKAEKLQQKLDQEFPAYQMGTMYTGFVDTCNSRLLCVAIEFARKCWVLAEMFDKDDSVIVGYERGSENVIDYSFRPES